VDDYDYEEEDFKMERRLTQRRTRQRIEHWHPQDPDYVEEEDEEDEEAAED
jgi:hypothetical protein